MKKPSRVSALLLGFVAPGLGQAYLGQWRRAALWAFVPLPVFLCYSALLVRLQWAAAYGSFAPATFVFWFGWFVARSVDVFVIPEDRIRAVPAARLFAFWLGAIVSLVGLSFVNRTFFVEAFKIPAGSMAPTPREHGRSSDCPWGSTERRSLAWRCRYLGGRKKRS